MEQNLGNSTDALNASNGTQRSDDEQSTLEIVFSIGYTAGVLVIMLGMGSTIEFLKLWNHLRRPIAPSIGMLSQFIVLPLATFAFAHALQLDNYTAISMLIMGTCPSGILSNFFTYWADGDVSLSLTMTSLNTLVSLGAMPLNLFIYSRSWTNEGFVIPYKNIALSLVIVIIPPIIGAFIRYKKERVAIWITKAGSICGAVIVVKIVVVASILYPFIYSSPRKTYLAAVSFSCIGFAFGFAVAKIFRMDSTQARTVGLETGIQNYVTCVMVIDLSFPKSTVTKLISYPHLYALFQIINSCLFVFGYHAIKRLRRQTFASNDVTYGHENDVSIALKTEVDRVDDNEDMTFGSEKNRGTLYEGIGMELKVITNEPELEEQQA